MPLVVVLQRGPVQGGDGQTSRKTNLQIGSAQGAGSNRLAWSFHSLLSTFLIAARASDVLYGGCQFGGKYAT